MSKFAGFLKRVKQFARKGVNISAKVLQNVYNKGLEYARPVAAAALDVIVPGLGSVAGAATKPIQQLQDGIVNKGLNWIINKTEPSVRNSGSVPPRPVRERLIMARPGGVSAEVWK